MSCFPFFMELAGHEGLIVGGSSVALRKVEKLLPYGPHLTVCAPYICKKLRDMGELTLIEAPFTADSLENKSFVIAATNDRDVNANISRLCTERHIPVNVVDDRRLCTFIFPALVKRGELSIGICTGGASPTAAVYWKRQIGEMIPEDFGALLEWLDRERSRSKATLMDEASRSRYCSTLFSLALEHGAPLSEEETSSLLEVYSRESEIQKDAYYRKCRDCREK